MTSHHATDIASTAAGSPAETTRPVVLVAGAAGQDPKLAEIWEDTPGQSVVKVVYLTSRTSAHVARKRILGPAPGPAGSDQPIPAAGPAGGDRLP